MGIVKVNDKYFQPFITADKIAKRNAELGKKLNEDYRGKKPILIAILNGAFVFAADLVRSLDLDFEIHFVRVSSYAGGLQTTGNVKELVGLNVPLEGRDVIIVEDIVDTGHTLHWLRGYIGGMQPASLRMVTLLFKEKSFEYDIPPAYIGFTIPPDFVVGYGLDYAELGRGLKEIYKLKEQDG